MSDARHGPDEPTREIARMSAFPKSKARDSGLSGRVW